MNLNLIIIISKNASIRRQLIHFSKYVDISVNFQNVLQLKILPYDITTLSINIKCINKNIQILSILKLIQL